MSFYGAAKHLVPNAYGPRTFGPPHLVPRLIGPSGQTVTNQFSPHGQTVPENSVPMDKWSLEYSVCPRGQAVGIRKYGDQIG